MRVRIMMTLHIDAEEYPIPADGRVDDEMEEYIHETFHEIEGVKVKNIKVVTEET
jgi:hypothetical protein|tara:strand:+ start:317 stop:481 length:165 start_codon:yes stop_codon:yes gene_type:complete